MDREWHLLVGGERREARSGRTATVSEPGTGKPLAEVAQAGPADVDDTLTIATAEFETGEWARTERHRAWTCARAGRPPAPRAGRGLRDRRGPQRGPSDRRRPLGGRRRGGDVFEYYAGAANKLFGEVVPIAGPRPRRRAARAGRRVRADRAVELPVADHDVEDRARARLRQPGRAEAGVAHAAHRAHARRAAGRGRRRPPARCRCSSGPGGPRSATRSSPTGGSPRSGSPARRRPARGILRASSDNITRVLARARRQVGVRRLRRRRPRALRRRDADGGVRQRRARTAAPAAGSWSSARSTTTSSPRSRPRTERVVVGDPLDDATEIGPMISEAQRRTSLDYLDIGAGEGRRAGPPAATVGGPRRVVT